MRENTEEIEEREIAVDIKGKEFRRKTVRRKEGKVRQHTIKELFFIEGEC